MLRVRFKHPQELVEVYTRDISQGGMFIKTEHPLKLEQQLLLEISTEGIDGQFELPAVVRRLGREPNAWGVGVEFVDMDPQGKQALWDFVAPLIEMDNEITIVED
ncbi:MAG: PilZ domain-containing protein [Myxococcota bacterium]